MSPTVSPTVSPIEKSVAQHAQRVEACYAYYEHLSNVIGRND